MSVLNSFPFDFLIFNEDSVLKWVSIKENLSLTKVFVPQSNYLDKVHIDSIHLKNLKNEGHKFTSVQVIDNTKYDFTHFGLSRPGSNEKLFGVFINASDNNVRNVCTTDEINEYCFLLFKSYENQVDERKSVEFESFPDLNDSLVNLLHQKKGEIGASLSINVILNYISLGYYFDSLKHEINERKNVFRYINDGHGNPGDTLLFSRLLGYLETKGVDIKVFFKFVGKVLGVDSLEELIHYFCEINEDTPFCINIKPTDELFQFVRDEDNGVAQDYPFFYQRIDSLESITSQTGVVSKLLLWESVNNLYWQRVI